MNEETKPGLSAEEKQECWQLIEKDCKPYGGFVNVITNCGGSLVSMVWIKSMQEYADQQTTALQQENQRLREANEWVSVEDRLPSDEESTEYLCYDSYHRQKRVLVFNPHHQCWDQEDGDDYYTDLIGGKVSHWMPLPTKPTTKNK